MLQKLSPQQIQMIKLLELPSVMLEQRIKQEIEENPVLEELEDEQPKEISVEEYLKEDDTPSYKYKSNNYPSHEEDFRQTFLPEKQTLGDYLEEQLGFRNLSVRDNTLALYIIGSLDDDGYLRRDLESLSDDIAFSLGLEVSTTELERVLGIIHTLEPAGIGARSMQECLVLQLEDMGCDTPAKKLAMKLLKTHFNEFSKKHFDKLMSRLDVDEEQLAEAIEEITHLSPKPANLFNGAGNDVMPYIIPDFILGYSNGQFDLSLNSYNVPDLKVNRTYVDMIRQLIGPQGASVSQDDREALKFIKNKLDSAKWFISAIKQRHDTLMFTMKEILEYQQAYFHDGDRSKLKPMILKDIADRTGLDVSTISRVVNSKYIQTHFGIIPLKQLFSEAMKTDSGEEVSSHEIKNILSECIEGEDKRHPLTDEVLMDCLNGKGYQIARRTVAKYREMLGIPVARLRREL